jgi:hypothetical protein
MRPILSPANRLASSLPPTAKMCRPMTVRPRYTLPHAVTASMTSIGTG